MYRIHRATFCWLLAGAAFVALPSPSEAQTTFTACRVPDVGAIYMIELDGAPSECLDPSHVEFSWTEGAPPVGCPSATRSFAGACFEEATRAAQDWFGASEVCGAAGRRLPTASELRGFSLESGVTLASPEVSSEIFYPDSGPTAIPEYVAVSETGLSHQGSATANAFRCVASLSN